MLFHFLLSPTVVQWVANEQLLIREMHLISALLSKIDSFPPESKHRVELFKRILSEEGSAFVTHPCHVKSCCYSYTVSQVFLSKALHVRKRERWPKLSPSCAHFGQKSFCKRKLLLQVPFCLRCVCRKVRRGTSLCISFAFYSSAICLCNCQLLKRRLACRCTVFSSIPPPECLLESLDRYGRIKSITKLSPRERAFFVKAIQFSEEERF